MAWAGVDVGVEEQGKVPVAFAVEGDAAEVVVPKAFLEGVHPAWATDIEEVVNVWWKGVVGDGGEDVRLIGICEGVEVVGDEAEGVEGGGGVEAGEEREEHFGNGGKCLGGGDGGL